MSRLAILFRPLDPIPHTQIRNDPEDQAIPDRTLLNCHFLSGPGLQELQSQLASGCFRIEVPEEGALLAVAWLWQQGLAASGSLRSHGEDSALDRPPQVLPEACNPAAGSWGGPGTCLERRRGDQCSQCLPAIQGHHPTRDLPCPLGPAD